MAKPKRDPSTQRLLETIRVVKRGKEAEKGMNSEVATVLRCLIFDRNTTQSEVARELGVTRGFLSYLLSGSRSATLEIATKLMALRERHPSVTFINEPVFEKKCPRCQSVEHQKEDFRVPQGVNLIVLTICHVCGVSYRFIELPESSEASRAFVSRLSGVPAEQILPVQAGNVVEFYKDRDVSPQVINLITQSPAAYWLAGDKVYFDDPYFGDPVAIDDLDYNSELGLHLIITVDSLDVMLIGQRDVNERT